MSTPHPAIHQFQGAYRWLSNFWPCKVIFDGVEYPSVEHAYQAAKTPDQGWRLKILAMDYAGDAKRAARQFPLREGWEGMKLDVMYDLVKQKFAQPPFCAWLIKTGNGLIEEGNAWNDTFWGVCRGRGENHLGKIIMAVRDEIQGREFAA